jgi:hypothetical protein
MDLRYSESRVTEDGKFQTLNDILLRYQTDEYLTPTRQVKLVSIINKKVKHLIFGQDMATNDRPKTTVHEHILSLMNVRETIRVHIKRASRYIQSMHPDNHNTFRDTNAEVNSSKHRKRKRGKEVFLDDKGKSQAPLSPCMICGRNTHDYNTLDLEGNPVHTNTHNGNRLEGEQHPIRFLSSNIDTLNSSNYLIVNISILQSKANIAPDLEEVEVNPPTSTEATTSHSNVDELRALLDTGCLVEDTISQEIVDSLDASHLLYDVNTTICSGFNNQCTDKFQCLKININFFNEVNSLQENFNTVVIVLMNSHIDLIIGRETIKK